MAALCSKVDPASAGFLGCPVIFRFRLSSAQSLEGFVEMISAVFPCPHFWWSLCEKGFVSMCGWGRGDAGGSCSLSLCLVLLWRVCQCASPRRPSEQSGTAFSLALVCGRFLLFPLQSGGIATANLFSFKICLSLFGVDSGFWVFSVSDRF